MHKLLLFFGICGLTSFLVAHMSAPRPASQRYNVLFIVADDWKPMAGCYGTRQIKTPNIDRLAVQGTVFRRNYCQQAVCAPTRASLLTGQRPDYTRVWDLETQIRAMNPYILTMPQYFRQHGYVTSGIGKVYDGRSVDKGQDSLSWSVPYHQLAGFGAAFQMYRNPQTRQRLDRLEAEAVAKGVPVGPYIQQRLCPVDEGEAVADSVYADGNVGQNARRIIRRLAGQQAPFFFAVGFRSPHLPFIAPKKYWDLYDRSKLTLAAYQQHSKNPVEVAYQPSGELVTQYTGTNGERFPKGYAPYADSVQRRLIHGYYASVSYMDAQVGLLLGELKASGLDKNTIVVLWGDHGWHLGDHAMWCKHTNFEQATRSPLIITAPGFQGNQQTESLTEFVDVFPTLCALTGLKTPDALPGKSLVSVLKKPATGVKTYAVSQYPRSNDKVMGYAIRTDRYRYVAWFEQDFRKNPIRTALKPMATELYDYRKDPDETENVAANAAYQAIVNQHADLLRDFLQQQSHPLASNK
ncbi:sulfatase [Spirosoma arcticum]